MNRLVRGLHIAQRYRHTSWLPNASRGPLLSSNINGTRNKSSIRCGAYNFVSPSEAATAALARKLASELRPGDCYCLYGDVGAGKSVFRFAHVSEVGFSMKEGGGRSYSYGGRDTGIVLVMETWD